MTEAALSLQFALAPVATGPQLRLTLEPDTEGRGTVTPGFAAIEAMLGRARSGLSARTVQREHCPCVTVTADGQLVLRLAVLVWPSRPELAYSLSLPAEARPGPVERHRLSRRWKFWTGGSRQLALPWMLERARIFWQPGFACVDEFSRPTPAPAISHEYAEINLAGDGAYGVLVAEGTAAGFRHPFSLTFAKLDSSGRAQAIRLDDVPVSATWIDETGASQSASVNIPVPDCAKQLLEACDDGRARVSIKVKPVRAGVWEIAYSACDGRILGSRYLETDHD